MTERQGADTAGFDIRPYEDADLKAVVSMLARSMGWPPDDRHEPLFTWKHRENPLGPSPAWVAVAADEIVGFRTFLRWEFQRSDQSVLVVRAVDTATDPAHRGRGIFRALTLHALEELRAEGFAFVFNTPNARSAAGYRTMDWQRVGRLPTLLRPRGLHVLPRLVGARVPADKWSLPCTAGTTAAEALRDADVFAPLLATETDPAGLRTQRSLAFLRWRYGYEPLAYRALMVGDTHADGLAIFRLRRRGPVIEAAVCDVLGTARRELIRKALTLILRETRADVAILLGSSPLRSASLALPKHGPELYWRGLQEDRMPPLRAWRLGLGDIELF